MTGFDSEQQYLRELANRSPLPEGFSAATATLDFTSLERDQTLSMNLALILLDEPASGFAGLFTKNRFCGAPITIGRGRMQEPLLRGILINNRVANVGACGGVEDAEQLCTSLGDRIGEPGSRILPASTGVVGWKLPVQSMKSALPELVDSLQRKSILPVARAIMTTDSYPKVHREQVGEGCIVGIVKGAGMIEPNMGTMLAFLLTDIGMQREQLRRCLRRCAGNTFNRISVDGDQSTSDMAVVLSSAKRPAIGEKAFEQALEKVCARLAEDVVRNGEGVGHVIRVTVRGAPLQRIAAEAGKAVVNSPLVKTAVFGNDPNVGRIVAALGDFADAADFPLDLERLRVCLGGVEIFAGGSFRLDADKESQLNRYMSEGALDPAQRGYPSHYRQVVLEIDLGAGTEKAEVLGSDLSYQYVKENADYRS